MFVFFALTFPLRRARCALSQQKLLEAQGKNFSAGNIPGSSLPLPESGEAATVYL
jgi:hypothetical protein